MSHFVFKLQPILTLKKQLEDNMKNELGKAVKKFEDEKETLMLFEKNREECIGQMKECTSKSINVMKLREYNNFITHLDRRISHQESNVKVAEENVDSCRKQLINAVKERESLDKLKEKKHYEFSREQIRHEQNLNDEIAGYSYNIKAGGI